MMMSLPDLLFPHLRAQRALRHFKSEVTPSAVKAYPWRRISINPQQWWPQEGIFLQWQGEQGALACSFKLQDKKSCLELIKNQKRYVRFRGPCPREIILKELYPLIFASIRQTLDEAQEQFQRPPAREPNPREDKGLAWIKMTFNQMIEAMNHTMVRPDRLFQSELKMGRDPQRGDFLIHWQLFNLESYFFFDPAGTEAFLKVAIFDNQKRPEEPQFQGGFRSLHREVLDELIVFLRHWTEACFMSYGEPKAQEGDEKT